VRERTDKLVRELVLDDPAPFVPLTLTKRGKEIEPQAAIGVLLVRAPAPRPSLTLTAVRRQSEAGSATDGQSGRWVRLA
jgi:hypothetical protein